MSLATRLYRQLRVHILEGALEPGARLPSARTLSTDLRLSRNTVEAALAQLVTEGFVVRRVGSGTVVADSLAEAAPFAAVHRRTTAARKHGDPRLPQPPATVLLPRRGREIERLGAAEIERDRGDRPCATDVRGFPLQTWTRLWSRTSRQAAMRLLGPSHPLGLYDLRQQIAEHAALSRGLRCAPEQVLVVSSTQQAIDLTARLLLDPGEPVLFEEPGYPCARAAFLAAGAAIDRAPVDDEGLMVDRLPTASRRVLYVTPSHQFPLGVEMSLARRLAVLRWASAAAAWVLEDDYDSEFRHDGRPTAALHALDQQERVIYAGSFNKTLFPGLRLAYLILPPALVDPFAAARRIVDGYSSPLVQRVLAEFMASGQFASSLRQARQHYAVCRETLVTHVQAEWRDAVWLGPATGGSHVVAHLARGTDDLALSARLNSDQPGSDGLGIAPLSRYYDGSPARSGLLLSYSSSTPTGIARTIKALAPHFARLERYRADDRTGASHA